MSSLFMSLPRKIMYCPLETVVYKTWCKFLKRLFMVAIISSFNYARNTTSGISLLNNNKFITTCAKILKLAIRLHYQKLNWVSIFMNLVELFCSNFMDTYRIKIMICCISIFYWYPTIWLFALSFDLSFAICYAQDFLTIWKKCWHLFLWCLLAAFSSLKYCKS